MEREESERRERVRERERRERRVGDVGPCETYRLLA